MGAVFNFATYYSKN